MLHPIFNISQFTNIFLVLESYAPFPYSDRDNDGFGMGTHCFTMYFYGNRLGLFPHSESDSNATFAKFEMGSVPNS